MARVTIEDCLEHVENRFALVHVTADRVRQLLHGAPRHVECKNKDIVTALREIAAGYVIANQAIKLKEDEVNLKIEIPEL